MKINPTKFVCKEFIMKDADMKIPPKNIVVRYPTFSASLTPKERTALVTKPSIGKITAIVYNETELSLDFRYAAT